MIYPVDSVIHPLNNWVQPYKFASINFPDVKSAYAKNLLSPRKPCSFLGKMSVCNYSIIFLTDWLEEMDDDDRMEFEGK